MTKPTKPTEQSQITQLDTFLAWAKTCPFPFNISSMQSRRETWCNPLKMVVHVKFELPHPEEEGKEEEEGESKAPSPAKNPTERSQP